MPVHVLSTMCSLSGGQKLYYTASGIITPIDVIGVMIPDAVFDLLMMSTWCSKHVGMK